MSQDQTYKTSCCLLIKYASCCRAVLSLYHFTGNPLEEKHSAEGDWRDKALARLPKLKKLDGVPVVSQEGDEEG